MERLKKVGVVGVPFEKGQKKYGVSVAPAAMRSAGLIERLREIGTALSSGAAAATAEAAKVRKYSEISRQYDFVAFAVETLGPWCQGAKDFFKALAPKLIESTGDRRAGTYFTQRISIAIQRGNAASFLDGLDVVDYGDIDGITPSEEDKKVDNMHFLPIVSECNRRLSDKVHSILKDDRIAVTIGGDHSIGVGTVDGHYRKNEDMILIWVDAHADINTNRTSGSGSVHGMPVALLVAELADYWPYLPTMDWQVPKLSIKRLGYLGLRSVDDYERLIIEKYKVPAFAMEDIDEHGIQNCILSVLHQLDPEQERPIHVSFDIDSLDVLEAPSTGTAVRGGLTLREGVILMEALHKTGRLRAIDLVEINPAIGDESDRRRTLEAGIAVLCAGLGHSRRGTAPRGVSDLPLPPHQ